MAMALRDMLLQQLHEGKVAEVSALQNEDYQCQTCLPSSSCLSHQISLPFFGSPRPFLSCCGNNLQAFFRVQIFLKSLALWQNHWSMSKMTDGSVRDISRIRFFSHSRNVVIKLCYSWENKVSPSRLSVLRAQCNQSWSGNEVTISGNSMPTLLTRKPSLPSTLTHQDQAGHPHLGKKSSAELSMFLAAHLFLQDLLFCRWTYELLIDSPLWCWLNVCDFNQSAVGLREGPEGVVTYIARLLWTLLPKASHQAECDGHINMSVH